MEILWYLFKPSGSYFGICHAGRSHDNYVVSPANRGEYASRMLQESNGGSRRWIVVVNFAREDGEIPRLNDPAEGKIHGIIDIGENKGKRKKT